MDKIKHRLRQTGWVLWDAYRHFAVDDGFAMASHVALSALTALFPFLIFGTALAGRLGANHFADTAVHLIFDAWPRDIAGPIADEVRRVLNVRHNKLLTLSVIAGAYFASNGLEALRVSLNRAYRQRETRPWLVTRALSLGYVMVAVLVFSLISVLLVAVPVALVHAEQAFPWLKSLLAGVSGVRIYFTLALLLASMVAAHLWLPCGRRRVTDVLPGVALTLATWAAAGALFASYIHSFANYAATYAGLASIMVVLIFLYISGAIFILGAEVNAALLKLSLVQAGQIPASEAEPEPDFLG